MSRKTPDSVSLYQTFVARQSRGKMDVVAVDGQRPKIRLFGPIDAFERTAESFVRALDEVVASGATEVDLEINSPGGSVSEALAIYDSIEASGVKFRAVILGLAASAASVVACACETVLIGRNARFMIHQAESGCFGRGSDMREVADWLDEINDQATELYVAKSGQSAEVIAAWMEEEKWFRGQEAVDAGFADGLLEADADPVVAEADLRAFQNPPADLVEVVQEEAETPADESQAAVADAQGAQTDEATDEVPAAVAEPPATAPAMVADVLAELKMKAEDDPIVAAMKSDADAAPVMTARPAEAAQQKTAAEPAPWAIRVAEMNRNFGRF